MFDGTPLQYLNSFQILTPQVNLIFEKSFVRFVFLKQVKNTLIFPSETSSQVVTFLFRGVNRDTVSEYSKSSFEGEQT